MANISFRRMKVGDIGLHLAVSGPEGGKPLVFLHGFPDFWYGWRKQIEYFGAQGYYVIAPDLRGYNKSDKPPKVSDYKMSKIAGDIERLIDHLSFQKPILIGHDWGGAICWWLAQNRPHLFEKCIIINAPHPNVMWENLKSNPKQMMRSWYVFLFQLPKLPEAFLNNRLINMFSERLLKAFSAKDIFTKDVMVEYRKAWKKPHAARSMINFYRAVMRGPFPPIGETKQIPIPLLLIWSKDDVAFEHSIASESLAHCDQGILVSLDDTSHWVQVEKPDEVNKLIEDFVKKST